jgi:hypothetical protein
VAVKKPYVGVAFAGVTLTAVLAGCSNSAPPTAGQDPSPSAASATPSSGDQGSGAPSSGPSGRPAVPVSQSTRCTVGDLKLSVGQSDAAAGTVYRTLRFTNVSARTCTLQGFPGVSYVAGDDGHQVGAAASRTPGGGGVVRLGAGQSASTVVALVNVHNYEAATCRPQPVRGLRVYPPGETRSEFVALQGGDGCGNAKVQQLSVKALQPGPGA